MNLQIKELKFEYMDGPNRIYEAKFEKPSGVSVHLSYDPSSKRLGIAQYGIDWAEWDAMPTTDDKLKDVVKSMRSVSPNVKENVTLKRLEVKESIMVAVADALRENKLVRS